MKLHLYRVSGGVASCYGRDINGPYAEGDYLKPVVVTVRSIRDAERILFALSVMAPSDSEVRACVETDDRDEDGQPWCQYYYATAEHVGKHSAKYGLSYAVGVL